LSSVASFERIEEHELQVTKIGKASSNGSPNSGSDDGEQVILPPEASSKASSWPDMATSRSEGSSIVNNVRKEETMDTSQNPNHEFDGKKSKKSSTNDKDTGAPTSDTTQSILSHKTDACEGKRELYIRNIDATLDERTIKKEFEVFVKVEQVRIVKQRKVCNSGDLASLSVMHEPYTFLPSTTHPRPTGLSLSNRYKMLTS
jgi:hypothetical protein